MTFKETGLATLIGIQNKKCSFKIHSDKVAFLVNSNVYFEALFTTIRRYGIKQNSVGIEFGRDFVYGQGELHMKSPKSQTIFDALKKQIEHVQQTHNRFN